MFYAHSGDERTERSLSQSLSSLLNPSLSTITALNIFVFWKFSMEFFSFSLTIVFYFLQRTQAIRVGR